MNFSTFYLKLHPRLVLTLAAVSGEVDLAADDRRKSPASDIIFDVMWVELAQTS